jgi:hypothetical protein
VEGFHEVELRDGTVAHLLADEQGGLPVTLRDGTEVSLELTEAEAG